jgi:hypothetical protein
LRQDIFLGKQAIFIWLVVDQNIDTPCKANKTPMVFSTAVSFDDPNKVFLGPPPIRKRHGLSVLQIGWIESLFSIQKLLRQQNRNRAQYVRDIVCCSLATLGC